jgi:hypothetical protein
MKLGLRDIFVGQVSYFPKPLGILFKFLKVSTTFVFPEFYFKFEFESRKVTITKVVPLFK